MPQSYCVLYTERVRFLMPFTYLRGVMDRSTCRQTVNPTYPDTRTQTHVAYCKSPFHHPPTPPHVVSKLASSLHKTTGQIDGVSSTHLHPSIPIDGGGSSSPTYPHPPSLNLYWRRIPISIGGGGSSSLTYPHPPSPSLNLYRRRIPILHLHS